MTTKNTALVAALIGCGAFASPAQAQWAPDFKVSGFGTLGAVRTNTDQAKFGRNRQSYGGATTDTTLDVDSNLGLQATASANDWLSATVQMLSVKRQTENHLTNEAEWAFVKVKPIQGLTIRGGRLSIPMFMISDSLNVGYANNWLRPPNEVYGLVSFRRLRGGDVSYALPLGSSTLTVTALAGSSETKYATIDLKMKNVRGANVQLETDWATFRIGRVQAQYATLGSHYAFTGYGVSVDRNNIVAQAEYVQKRAPQIVYLGAKYAEANGWYAMGGYRFGTLLPYASYAGTKPVAPSPVNTSATQKTAALGMRWDFYKAMAFKAQLEHIDTKHTKGISFSGPVSSPVTAASVALDFVF